LKEEIESLKTRNKELEDQCVRLSEYAMSLKEESKHSSVIKDLIEDKDPAARFIEKMKTEDSRQSYYLTIKFSNRLMVVQGDTLKEYLISQADTLRKKNVSDIRLTFDFSDTDFFTSTAHAAIFKFLSHFKETNGLELTFITPKKNKMFQEQMAVMSKEITGFNIQTVGYDEISP
jgi:hypothetical protein